VVPLVLVVLAFAQIGFAVKICFELNGFQA
jgi:hypothetical protein